jgi:hypothetical protein
MGLLYLYQEETQADHKKDGNEEKTSDRNKNKKTF